MIIDGKVGIIGTVNMDIRSFYINFEIAALFYDPDFCNKMELSFQEDKSNSKLIDPEKWLKRPVMDRFIDSICRLLTPLL